MFYAGVAIWRGEALTTITISLSDLSETCTVGSVYLFIHYTKGRAQSRHCDVALVGQTLLDNFRHSSNATNNYQENNGTKNSCRPLFRFIRMFYLFVRYIYLYSYEIITLVVISNEFTWNCGYESDDRVFSVSNIAVVRFFSSISRSCSLFASGACY